MDEFVLESFASLKNYDNSFINLNDEILNKHKQI